MQDELLIKAYFKGLLNEEQLEAFNARASKDSAFAIMVEDYGNVQAGIAENERLRLKKRFHQIEAKGLSQTKAMNYRRWLAVASVVILLGLGYVTFIQNNFNAQDTYLAYYEPYPNVLQPVTRGAEENNVETFSAYEAGNYDKAIIGFSEMLNTKEDADVRFYYAMSLLNNNQEQKALTELKKLEATDTRFLPQVHWYSALIHLKNEQFEQTKASLEKLQKFDNTFKAEEVEMLLNKLD